MKIGHNSKEKWKGVESALSNMLASALCGDVCTYSAMSAQCGVEITSQHPALRSALASSERDGVHFECVPGEGYRRLLPGDAATRGTRKSVLRIYRSAKRGLRKTHIKDREALSQEERTQLYCRQAVMQSIKTAAHGNSVNASLRRDGKGCKRSALDAAMKSFR